MSLKEKFKVFFNKVIIGINILDIFNEFEAELEDHEIGNQNIYRLHYIDYLKSHQGNEAYYTADWPLKPFTLPDGMSREDAFKVLSYLTDFIEKHLDIDEGSSKSVRTLDSVLDLERFGFKHLKEKISDDEVIDLFTVGGRIRLFLTSKYYPKYFNWYTSNIQKEEVEEIYRKCAMEFKDPIILSTKKESAEKEKRTTEEELGNLFNNLIDGVAVNIDPLKEIPDAKITIYGFIPLLANGIYFDTKDALDEYMKTISPDTFGHTIMIEYLGEMAGRKDVIRITSSVNQIKYFAPVDTDGCAIYNNKRSIYTGKFIWEYDYITLREYYEALKKRGIALENDIYAKKAELIREFEVLDKHTKKLEKQEENQ